MGADALDERACSPRRGHRFDEVVSRFDTTRRRFAGADRWRTMCSVKERRTGSRRRNDVALGIFETRKIDAHK
jgi:hypothetical protein